MSHKEVSMSSQERSFERVNQKRRTRAELVRAARELIERGEHPSVADVADHAQISRATAYRYFSAPDELLREAVLDTVASKITVREAQAGAGLPDVEKRLDKLVCDVFDMVSENEAVFRTLLAASSGKSPSRRGGRRNTWIMEALAPLKEQLQPQQYKNLVSSLALLTGIEALVVMKDVCELPPRDAKRVLRWTAKALLSETAKENSAISCA
jgi:AcrR family transcriptional regulator